MSRDSRAVSVTITRPANATPYTAADVIGDTNGSAILIFEGVGSDMGEVAIDSVDIRENVAAVPAGQTTFDLHLYNAAPTAIADNAAYDLVAGDRAKYLGKITLSAMVDEGSTIVGTTVSLGRSFQTVGGKLYGLLKTVGAFTPGSGDVFVVTLHCRQL